jgi:uncharacterized membrane protein YgcG
MQQRRVRLGDILDDYCPRERRITNHAVVAMIEETVRLTRCTTCDAEHDYKEAKVPLQRRRKPEGVLVPRPAITPAADAADIDESLADTLATALDGDAESLDSDASDTEALDPMPQALADDIVSTEEEPIAAAADDEWPVHRPLIRATLPRPEGHVPERKEPDFTMRAPGRFDGQRNGQRHGRGGQRGRQAQGQFGGGQSGGGQFGGGQRQGGGFQGERNGNRAPNPQGRGGRNGQNRGPRPAGPGQGQGRGPKRGR